MKGESFFFQSILWIFINQVIQFVTYSPPIVGGHVTYPTGHLIRITCLREFSLLIMLVGGHQQPLEKGLIPWLEVTNNPLKRVTFHAELPGMFHPTDSEVGTCSFRFALLRLATWQQRQQLQILPAFRAKFNRSPLTNGGKGTQSFLLGPKGSFSRASCQTSRLYIYPSNVPYFFPLNKFSSQKFLKVFNEDDFFWNKIYKSQRDFEPEWRWPRCLHQWPQGLELPMDFHVSRNRIHWGVLFFSLARYPNTLEIKAKFW